MVGKVWDEYGGTGLGEEGLGLGGGPRVGVTG